MTDNIDDIISGCIKEDRQSQEKLYRLFSPGMYAVCLQYASDKHEANDFLQEGFIRVFLKIKTYRWEGSFEGWVRKIMVNTALQFIRKKKQIFILDEKVADDFDYQVSDGQLELEKEDLLSLIQELPVNQRTVFNLFVMEGFNHLEISKMMGISENTSKSHLHRARVALKEMINSNSSPDNIKLRKYV